MSVELLTTHLPCSLFPRSAKIRIDRLSSSNLAIRTWPKLMNHPPRSPVVYALYINAALLLAILAVILGRAQLSITSSANAQTATEQPIAGGGIAGGGGIFVMPCQLHPQVWGCYLLDTQRQSLCVYEYRAGEKALILSAARNFRYDLDLKNYNTFPAWYDIQKAVDDAAKNQRINESQLPSVVPPAPRDNNP
ncbi:MAG: hypothetical protein ABSB33_10895 [Tepidisphaeraceae bacterium]|jgi:hypothetical protein